MRRVQPSAACKDFLSLGPPNPVPFTPPVGILVESVRGRVHISGKRYDDVRRTEYSRGFSGSPSRLYRELELRHPARNYVDDGREVAYVGSKITHLFWNRQENANDPLLLSQWGTRLNDVVPNPYYGKVTTGTLSFPTVVRKQLLRPFPQYQQILAIRRPYGDASYQSMTARFEKRYSSNLTFSVAYTLSKSLSSTGESNTWVVGPSNALYDPKYNRSHEANDTPHRLVISHVYDLPFGKGKRWAQSGIAQLGSGRMAMEWHHGAAGRTANPDHCAGQHAAFWISRTPMAVPIGYKSGVLDERAVSGSLVRYDVVQGRRSIHGADGLSVTARSQGAWAQELRYVCVQEHTIRRVAQHAVSRRVLQPVQQRILRSAKPDYRCHES